ncbi:hypothetical protein [Tunicatimonas pelagia]|uniref:hypothetical protein n=1 Tax=Tunicatimonas pelagia TaxID=931531 RepID=UPI002665FA92|nr:hypothetical protein [Tunicatimonas pelagia]WKN46521.1 hypothetical protein P0M28_30900 [Tunicatimonas pelagia]
MDITDTLALLNAYDRLQNDFSQSDSIQVFGESAGFNIWDKFEANNNQFPLWMLGDTERHKLAAFLLARIEMEKLLGNGNN